MEYKRLGPRFLQLILIILQPGNNDLLSGQRMQKFDLKRASRAMKTTTKLIIVLLTAFQIVGAQVTLRGRVTDDKGISLPGANVLLQGTYDGASADTGGYFKFRTSESGQQTLVASFIGYKTFTKEIDLADVSQPITLVLEEQSGEIKGVIITAGAFETGELKRPIVLQLKLRMICSMRNLTQKQELNTKMP